MSDFDENMAADLIERTCDAHDPTERQALFAWIASHSTAERSQWSQLIEEIDSTRVALAEVQVPANLESQLSSISMTPPRWHWRGLTHYRLRNWQIAASFAVVAVLVGYWLWPQEPARVVSLDAQQVQQIANFGSEQQSAALKVASDDPAKVFAALQAEPLGFQPTMPHAASTLKLLGGGITHFGNTPVAFTRWHDASGDLSLYQFDANAFQFPAQFCPTDAYFGGQHLHLAPGPNHTALATIFPAELPSNPFCD